MSCTVANDLEVTKSYIIWKLNNFSQRCETWTYSGDFSLDNSVIGNVGSNIKLVGLLMLDTHTSSKKDCDDHIRLYLHITSTDILQKSRAKNCFELAIVDSTGNKVKTQMSQLVAKHKSGMTLQWRWDKLIRRNYLLANKNTLLKDDTLTISLSLKGPYLYNHQLSNQYESLYLAEEFSDVTIVIGNKEIKAHKCILSNKSKVFSAMLKHNMQEGNTNIINIIDVDYDVMREFLLFVYCGKVLNVKDSADSLLPLADKYDIIELKELCGVILSNNVTVDNACEILRMADLYNCKELKIHVLSYMVKHINEITTTQSFHDLSNSNIALLKEILLAVVKPSEKKIDRTNLC